MNREEIMQVPGAPRSSSWRTLRTEMREILRDEPGLLGRFDRRYREAQKAGAEDPECLSGFLVEAFAATGNLDLFQVLYKVSFRLIRIVIQKYMRYLRVGAEAQDILQEVYMSIYRYPHRFRDEKPSSFRNWSYSIVRNAVLKNMRRPGPVEVDLDSLVEEPADVEAVSPRAEISAREELDRLGRSYQICLLAYQSAFQTALNEREQTVLKLIELEGLTYKVVAERVGVHVPNLKMIVSRARRKLLGAMQRLFWQQQRAVLKARVQPSRRLRKVVAQEVCSAA